MKTSGDEGSTYFWTRTKMFGTLKNYQEMRQSLWAYNMEYMHHEQPPVYFGEWEASWGADPLALGNDQDADSNPPECPSMLC
ncbi:hypothetical protein GUITHDRAFT_109278 [Guillardia theta CCMP2712]|uniref:Uncharacterized protein n=1 Tax=Guillardia theta (strain CCMP2712) TaxID=905079 RepID=L1J9U2_GUITC|nr:hypothetical protein GUITHDRAFT_109278 [Guillardia theta CCMP2712]EKX44855.1 hypothetical protein GUITHDRAFT_109278 [Guillardia theta CCMP2712]|eukprot:XP_005831835.1 hypothetical protein GUITHDRAFT_109278 [Guillardia theta CCMP2712]